MVTNVEALRAQFPLGIDVPELLLKLLQWRNHWDQRNLDKDLRDSIGFDLYAGDNCLGQWFGEGTGNAASQFVVFGTNPTGSMFAYWLYSGRTIETAPVVILDSEGSQFSYVMAGSLEAFLKLLATGEDALFSLPSLEDEYLPVKK